MQDGLAATPQRLSWQEGKATSSAKAKIDQVSGGLIDRSGDSDTTAPSLITLFYLLARHPEDAETIRRELNTVDVQDVKAVATLPHLNGAINEAMRLLPAVLTFVTRVTPREGLDVGGTHIPGNVKVAAPRYSIGRRKYYQRSQVEGSGPHYTSVFRITSTDI